MAIVVQIKFNVSKDPHGNLTVSLIGPPSDPSGKNVRVQPGDFVQWCIPTGHDITAASVAVRLPSLFESYYGTDHYFVTETKKSRCVPEIPACVKPNASPRKYPYTFCITFQDPQDPNNYVSVAGKAVLWIPK